MKIEVTMENLKPTAIEFFHRELALLEIEYSLELQNALEKYKKDRNITNRIINFMSRKGINMTLEDFLSSFEMISETKLFSYNLLKKDFENKKVIATIELSELYFEMVNMVRSLPMGRALAKTTGQTKKQFKKRWEKIVNNDPYNPEFSRVDVLEDGEDN